MRVPRTSIVVLLAALVAATCVASAQAQRTATSGVPPGWAKVERQHAGDVRPATAGGRSALRITVHPGDRPVRSGERTELVASAARTGATEGATRVYRWSTFLPSSLHPIPNSTWNIFTQWHGTAADGCHPNVALQVNTQRKPAMLRLQVRGGRLDGCQPQASRSWDFAPVTSDAWNDFALRVHWSSGPDGTVELTVDGHPAVPETAVATLYPGEGAYLKQGFYRGPSSPLTSTLFQTTPSITAG